MPRIPRAVGPGWGTTGGDDRPSYPRPGAMHPAVRHLLDHLCRPGPAHEVSDAALLALYAGRRDQSAFADLVARHGPMVLRVCRRVLPDPRDVEDAFQATFLALARGASTVRRADAVAAWRYGTAGRIALKVRRDRSRRRDEGPAPGDPTDRHRGPLDELTGREVLAVVDEEIAGLPEVYRLPVLLCCLEGLSQEEVATRLGWSAGSLRGRLERGRRLLHARLARRGLTLSAALAAAELTRGPAAAVVPAVLARATVRSALGGPAEVSARTAVLAEGALRGTATTGVKLRLALLLAVSLATAAGVAARRGPDEPARPAQRPRTDAHGDPLPQGVLVRLGTNRFRTGGAATSGLAFSPDGKTVLTSGYNAPVSFTYVATGKEGRRFGDCPIRIGSVAFSPDGRRLATATLEGAAQLWDAATGKVLHDFGGTRATTVVFSPDGKLVASVHTPLMSNRWPDPETEVVRVSDAATGVRLRELRGHSGAVWTVAFAPDGKTLASGGSDRKIRLWDVAAWREIRALECESSGSRCLAFAPDGATLASGHPDGAVRLW